MLTITNVKKTFNKGTVNEKKALNGINLHLAPGDFVTIIGGNGAGKSTMLNMIAGVYPIDSGKIEIDGVNISREPEYKRAKYIGRVFQAVSYTHLDVYKRQPPDRLCRNHVWRPEYFV